MAVLKIDQVPAGVTPVSLGKSGSLTVGQDVVAIGNPYGYSGTATTGIVSALKRTIASPSDFPIQNAIQTDAAINQGNSGGPLFDRAGRVIGINSQIASETGGNVGIGIQGGELTPALAQKLGLGTRRGVLVLGLDSRGPAKKGGLKAARDTTASVPTGADLIVAINGTPVADMADVAEAVASRKVGDQITVTILRDGASQTVTLTLKDRPADIGVK